MPSEPVIAYIAQAFPYLTETFVYREVLALQQRGVQIVTLSNHRPPEETMPPEVRDLADRTYYVKPLNILKLMLAHLYFFTRRPRAYFSALFLIFSERSRHIGVWIQDIRHFVLAVYLAYQVRDEHISHIHAHFASNPASFALYISRLLRIPFSFTLHNSIFWKQLLLNSKMRHADFIACISEYSRDALLDYALPAEREMLAAKMHIIHCGIESAQFAIENPVRHEVPVILSAAQFEERKGFPVLVEACHILKQRGFDFECILAGDGRQRNLLHDLVKKYDLESRVRFSGSYFQDQMPDLLRGADVFVLSCVVAKSGDRDGIPVVLMEAMAAGIPVISTRVSGIPELIDHMWNGILVEPRDPEALADAITLVLNDEALYATFRAQARQKILEDFSLQKNVDVLMKLLLKKPSA